MGNNSFWVDLRRLENYMSTKSVFAYANIRISPISIKKMFGSKNRLNPTYFLRKNSSQEPRLAQNRVQNTFDQLITTCSVISEETFEKDELTLDQLERMIESERAARHPSGQEAGKSEWERWWTAAPRWTFLALS